MHKRVEGPGLPFKSQGRGGVPRDSGKRAFFLGTKLCFPWLALSAEEVTGSAQPSRTGIMLTCPFPLSSAVLFEQAFYIWEGSGLLCTTISLPENTEAALSFDWKTPIKAVQ